MGAVLLPAGVLATSATSCEQDEGVTAVQAVEGRFSGTDRRAFFVVEDQSLRSAKVDPLTGTVSGFPAQDQRRVVEADASGTTACDGTGMTCWRVEDQVVKVSRDGGLLWSQELIVSEEEQARSVEGVDPRCGDDASAWMVWVAVLDTDAGTAVAVSAKHAGIWLRSPAGEWRLVPRDSWDAEPVADEVWPTRVTLRGVYVPPARSQEGWAQETPEPSVPTPSCASPSTRTVTPNPLNGPPTTLKVCP